MLTALPLHARTSSFRPSPLQRLEQVRFGSRDERDVEAEVLLSLLTLISFFTGKMGRFTELVRWILDESEEEWASLQFSPDGADQIKKRILDAREKLLANNPDIARAAEVLIEETALYGESGRTTASQREGWLSRFQAEVGDSPRIKRPFSLDKP